MTMNKKKMRKAIKHLQCSRENLQYWRESYVENERNTSTVLDIKPLFSNMTIREERRKECLAEIKEAKERIAKFERIVL